MNFRLPLFRFRLIVTLGLCAFAPALFAAADGAVAPAAESTTPNPATASPLAAPAAESTTPNLATASPPAAPAAESTTPNPATASPPAAPAAESTTQKPATVSPPAAPAAESTTQKPATASPPAAPAAESTTQKPATASPPAAPVPVASPGAPDETELAALKGKLAGTESELEAALRTYTLLKEDYDKAAAEAARTQDALRQAEEAKAGLAKVSQELAALKELSDKSDAELATVREILRQTRDTNAALATENAHLKTELAQPSPGPVAGSAASPSRPTSLASMPAPSAATPGPDASAAPPSAPRHHTVVKGDTLTGLSKKYYGTSARWQEIFAANRALIKKPDVLPGGAELVIP